MAILSSVFRLRERIAQLLFLCRENAADLFPRKISHLARESATIDQGVESRESKNLWRKSRKVRAHVPRPIIAEGLDLEGLPDVLQDLAEDVKTFLNRLDEFPEFTDDAVNGLLLSFERDLKVRNWPVDGRRYLFHSIYGKYWASCLREYRSAHYFPS